jgi:serine/threonine protein phosphatase PrpC
MARLETEINQIYLNSTEGKKASLILYEEEINNSAHLFILAELKNLQRKSEATDLKKISEIILGSFRANKRLAAEALFESALAQANQNLADLAHEGHKSWVGKFSCLIALKSGENIYIANNGQTSAWLLRKTELLEILKPEKRGTHPLKSFVNFTQGKLNSGDGLVITTSNIFNFISVELFEKIISGNSLERATNEISKILQDSKSSEEGFSSFLLGFKKPGSIPETKPQPTISTPIYAPLPEVETSPVPAFQPPKLAGLPKISLPKISLPKFPRIKFQFFQNLSTSGKFFFISFSIFLLLFLGNLGVYGVKLHSRKTQDRISAQADALAHDLANAQSALIYKNNSDALKFLNKAEDDFTALQKLSAAKASEFSEQLQSLKDQVNKVSVINDPKVFIELKHQPIFLNRSSLGILLANHDSNSLSRYDGKTLKDYFLLNSLKSEITGISVYGPAGPVIASGSAIYHIDQNLKQYEPIVSSGSVLGAEAFGNNLYTLNSPANQVTKIGFSKGKYTTTPIPAGNLSNIRDFGADKDIYLLYTDKVIKLAGNNLQNFPLPALTDPITNATKIFIGSNVYILETNKKRVAILNKNGQLLNQIYFPSLDKLFDLSVDEASRSLYILGDNKLYKITF